MVTLKNGHSARRVILIVVISLAALWAESTWSTDEIWIGKLLVTLAEGSVYVEKKEKTTSWCGIVRKVRPVTAAGQMSYRINRAGCVETFDVESDFILFSIVAGSRPGMFLGNGPNLDKAVCVQVAPIVLLSMLPCLYVTLKRGRS